MNYATHSYNEPPTNYRSMSDAQLLLEIDRLTVEAEVIVEQLIADQKEGHPATRDWRRRAQVARAHKIANLKLAENEYARRHIAEKSAQANERVLVKEAERRASEAKRAEHEAKIIQLREEKQIKRAEAEAEAERRKIARANMFFAAACRCLSLDDRARIWIKAKEMFPESLDLEATQ